MNCGLAGLGRQIENVVKRESAKELTEQLNAVQHGLASKLPRLDWSALPLFGRLGRLVRCYTFFTENVAREFGLTYTEQQVLSILRSGQAETPGMLAKFAQQTAAGMTRTVDRLVARGLVDRRVYPANRRKVQIRLSQKGLRVTDHMLTAETAVSHALLNGLTDTERGRICIVLDELIERFAPQHTSMPVQRRRGGPPQAKRVGQL